LRHIERERSLAKVQMLCERNKVSNLAGLYHT
jgi:hypothetical protein